MSGMTEQQPLLRVKDLSVRFGRDADAVKHVSFDIHRGETLALVGESGSGKSVTALSVLQLLPYPLASHPSGSIAFRGGEELVGATEPVLRDIRGNRIAMVFQEPMTALNPVQTIGRQLTESLELHTDLTDQARIKKAIAMLDRVGIPAPDIRMAEYPHQLSGGMRQRVVIAMALICEPNLLIADEPTTALDVTIQAQILDLIKELQREMGMAVIMITHDLGVIAETSEEMVVMYAGRVAEQGSVYDVFASPRHPYTDGLMQSIPKMDSTPKERLKVIDGLVPSLHELPKGCRFNNRCPEVSDICFETMPEMTIVSERQSAACHNVGGAS